jgi:hypothetical protein
MPTPNTPDQPKPPTDSAIAAIDPKEAAKIVTDPEFDITSEREYSLLAQAGLTRTSYSKIESARGLVHAVNAQLYLASSSLRYRVTANIV